MTERAVKPLFSEPELDFIYHISRKLAVIGDYERAKKILEGLIHLHPSDKTVCLLAFVYLALDETEKAESVLMKFKPQANPSFSRLAIFALLKILKSQLNDAELVLEELDKRYPSGALNDLEKSVRNFIEAHLILRKN